MFKKKGYIAIDRKAVDEEKLMEKALEAGAEDVREDDGTSRSSRHPRISRR